MLILIVVLTLVISLFHYTAYPAVWPLHNIYMDLYYIPVLISALVFGLRGALISFTAVVCLYFPYIILVWKAKGLFLAEDCLHTLFLGMFACVAGFLADRERRRRIESKRDEHFASLGRAASVVAHDLRSPLTAIEGFARRLREGKTDPDTAIRAIVTSAETMRAIVDNTLDFARPLRGTPTDHDMVGIVARAVLSCTAKAEKQGVTITQDLPEPPVPLAVDGFLIERALVNVINNAIEASQQGGEVRVAARRNGSSTIVSIQDQGEGMDKKSLQEVFTPFHTSKEGGTGIGLAVTKRIVDTHHGTVRVRSKPGSGTTVEISLPS